MSPKQIRIYDVEGNRGVMDRTFYTVCLLAMSVGSHFFTDKKIIQPNFVDSYHLAIPPYAFIFKIEDQGHRLKFDIYDPVTSTFDFRRSISQGRKCKISTFIYQHTLLI